MTADLTCDQELELVAGHTAKSITDEDLTALYAIAARQAAVLRNVRLVTERMSSAVRSSSGVAALAIRGFATGVTLALDEQLPDPRAHDRSVGWAVPCTEERTR